jgi:hypothetical protein
MATRDDINRVNQQIDEIFRRRKAAAYAKSLQFAAKVLNYFRQQQANERYWQNQTGTARDAMFTKAFIETDELGWLMSHGVQYGVYLELANDGKHAAIRPVINKFYKAYEKEIREIYGK